MDTWRDCWAVFKTAAVMLDLARPATLDSYAANFEDRCRRYPRAWHLCAQADIRCRAEFMVDERRRQEAFHQRVPQLSSFMVLAPWDSVIKAAATHAEFWERELKEPAIIYSLGHGKTEPSFVERQPQQLQTEGTSKRALKRKRELANFAARQQQQHPPEKQQQPHRPQQPKGKGNGKGQHPRKDKAGLYISTRDGSQICYSWTQGHDGCKAPCPNGRAHVCQRCLGSHRTVSCSEGGGSSGNKAPHM